MLGIFIVVLSVRRYIELYAAFDAIDTGDDDRIDYDEFRKGCKMMTEWNVTVSNPKKEFAAIDKNGGGQVLFDEFCEWALAKGLDYDNT